MYQWDTISFTLNSGSKVTLWPNKVVGLEASIHIVGEHGLVHYYHLKPENESWYAIYSHSALNGIATTLAPGSHADAEQLMCYVTSDRSLLEFAYQKLPVAIR